VTPRESSITSGKKDYPMSPTIFQEAIKILTAGTVGAILFGSVSLGETPSEQESTFNHREILEARLVDPSQASGCAAAEAAYALAVAQMIAAQDAADDALSDLYDCQNGGGQYTPQTLASIKADTVSILD